MDWAAMLEDMSAGACVAVDGRLVYANTALQWLFRCNAEQIRALGTMRALLSPEDQATAHVHARHARSWVPQPPVELQCRRPGDGVTFDARIQAIRWQMGPRQVDLWIVNDITASRQVQRAAQEQQSRLESMLPDLVRARQLLDQLPLPMLLVDEQGTLHDANTSLATLLGYDRATLLRTSLFELAPHRHPALWPEQLRSLIGQPVRHLPSDWVTASGRPVSIQIHAAHTVCQDRDMALICATPVEAARPDVPARQDNPRSPTHCEITGLPNTQLFRERLRAHALVAVLDQRQLIVLVFTVNELQLIQESNGFQVADQVLQVLALRLSAIPQGADLLAHLGQGEFALLVNNPHEVSDDTVLHLSRQIQDAILTPLPDGLPDAHLSCNIGAVVYPRDTGEVEHLLRQGQTAMRLSLALGPNRVYGYTPEANAHINRRRQIDLALRGAKDRQEFHVDYQPQVDLKTGRIHAVEALIRWQHPELGQVPPEDFLPVAEETGLIYLLGAWVMRQACEAAVQWLQAGLPAVRMSVNVSARQLQLSDFAASIEALLMQVGLPPHGLVIEITEGMLHGSQAVVRANLQHLKAIGVGIALDEFGTGQATLQSLRRLPIDLIKIDRSLVPDVTTDAQDVSLTRAIINMAHGLQKQVLAMGVETAGELAMLCANQCDLMQGFVFSPPLPFEGMTALLRENRCMSEQALGRQRRRRTLLIVDDDQNIVSSLLRLLRRDGYHIITAANGPDGLQRLAENEVDVILSDQRMPGMTGVEFLRRAKALYPDTVRLVLSGFTELRSVTDAINEGAIYKFLTKPWEDEQLRAHIEEAFHQKEMSDDNRRLDREVQEANRELADVNSRLKHLLESQREHIHREETNLVVAREMLENIPVPVIGLDAQGMVAFMNSDADRLFTGADTLLGRHLIDMPDDALHRIWQQHDGHHHRVTLCGHEHLVVCRPLQGTSHSRGTLMVMLPSTPMPTEGGPRHDPAQP
jgi:diguanylate cyclase (GGDEF)-like protein/PAS domain S-box-containing protein